MQKKSTKPARDLTLRDRLSRLSFIQVSKLLGESASKLMQLGNAFEIDLNDQVKLQQDRLLVRFPGVLHGGRGKDQETVVTIEKSVDARDYLKWSCSACDLPCAHAGATFALVLEEKMALGLAEPPAERKPIESLGEEELVAQAIAERVERARTEKMDLRSSDPAKLWSDYLVASALSGKTYRLALRGWERGESFCSCPDFRKNTLGTCKHILHALAKLRRRFSGAERAKPYVRTAITVHLRYGPCVELRLALPASISSREKAIVAPLRDRAIEDCADLLRRIRQLEAAGAPVQIYPDAEEHIQERLFQSQMESKVAAIRADPANHPLRKELLKTELLPYQLDGIAFVAGAGRAILADDMGLGKTIQGVGVAEFLAREAGIRKVLVICPASLKSQWKAEITRFSDRGCQLVLGSLAERGLQYGNDSFFTLCNYEQVLRDLLAIEKTPWDLIILDEGQRIKNWEAKTSRVLKGLKSRFALVLTGTPLENRLDDLFSVVEFIDEHRLGPAFRFFNRHRLVDEKGKVLGYKELDLLRARLRPILLRRTRELVMQQLPPRTTEIVRIPPTEEQLDLHASHMRVVSSIVRKHFISEMDLLRLQKALLMCRLSADGTALVDKVFPGHSSKLERLDELLGELGREKDRKILIFSEWTTMLDMISKLLEKHGLPFVRLDGQVPQKKRQQLVHEFQTNPQCQAFITTNAGSTGLNLQAANTVINIDLPWNPAILEQRIARAHRMGQKRPVQVFILVTEGTIEENLLATLSAKHELARAALDFDSDVEAVSLQSGIEELKRRLEVLLGAKPEAAVDETRKSDEAARARQVEQRERMAAAGGQLLCSALAFLGQLIPPTEATEESNRIGALFRQQLDQCLEKDVSGRIRLTIALPDDSALAAFATSLGRIAASAQSK